MPAFTKCVLPGPLAVGLRRMEGCGRRLRLFEGRTNCVSVPYSYDAGVAGQVDRASPNYLPELPYSSTALQQNKLCIHVIR